MRRGLALTQRIAAFLGLGLAIAAVVLFVVAAETAGTDCTFDHFGCGRTAVDLSEFEASDHERGSETRP